MLPQHHIQQPLHGQPLKTLYLKEAMWEFITWNHPMAVYSEITQWQYILSGSHCNEWKEMSMMRER